MRCPVCKTKLENTPYEEARILLCPDCKGALISQTRVKTIQSRREKSQDELRAELAEQGDDTMDRLRCSRCLSRMEKRRKSFGSEEFCIDQCNRCELIWLDKGEIAKMQVLYEFSEQGKESERFRERHENMTSEEKKELAERIAKLPDFSQRIAAGDILAGSGGRYGFGVFLAEMLDD